MKRRIATTLLPQPLSPIGSRPGWTWACPPGRCQETLPSRACRRPNRYGYQHYRLNLSDLDMEGYTEASVFYDEQGWLAAVLTVHDRARFDLTYNGLRARYRTVSEDIPFVGNKSARFEDGDTTIDLDAPRLSFALSLHKCNLDLLRVEGNRTLDAPSRGLANSISLRAPDARRWYSPA